MEMVEDDLYDSYQDRIVEHTKVMEEDDLYESYQDDYLDKITDSLIESIKQG